MDKWFDDKFEKESWRRYTLKKVKKKDFFRKFSVTNWIIFFTISVSVVYSIFENIILFYYGGDASERFFYYFSLQPNLFFDGRVWTVFTSMFLHGGFFHLLVNMFSLFFVGNFLERIIGRKRFFWLYVVSGVLAGLFFAFLSYYLGNVCIFKFFNGCIGEKIFSNPEVPAVGASGAIFALVGLLSVLTPRNKVYLIAGPLIAIVIQSIFSLFPFFPSIASIVNFIVTIYFVVAFVSLFSFNPNLRKISIPIEMAFWLLPFVAIVPLLIISFFVSLPIGNTAHIGGLIVGFIYGAYLKKRYKKKTEFISKIFSR